MSTPRMLQLEQMLKDEPLDSFLNYAMALEYANTGAIDKAVQLIESLLMREPNYLGAYYQLGKYYELLGRTEDAVTIYKRGIAISQLQNNGKTQGELREALWMLDEE